MWLRAFGYSTAFMRNQLLNLIYILCAFAMAVIASPATCRRGGEVFLH